MKLYHIRLIVFYSSIDVFVSWKILISQTKNVDVKVLIIKCYLHYTCLFLSNFYSVQEMIPVQAKAIVAQSWCFCILECRWCDDPTLSPSADHRWFPPQPGPLSGWLKTRRGRPGWLVGTVHTGTFLVAVLAVHNQEGKDQSVDVKPVWEEKPRSAS